MSSLRRLDPSQPYKPLDLGEAGVSASVDAQGRLLSVGWGHREHGFVTLAPRRARIAEGQRFDEAAVRRFRRLLSSPRAAGFGLRAEARRPPRGRSAAWLLEDAIPLTAVPGSPGARVATFVPHPDDAGGARGVLQVVLPGRARPRLVWRGDVRLARASYPELTEVRPLPPPATRPVARALEGGVVVEDRLLATAAALVGDFVGDARAGRRSDGFEVTARLRPGARAVALGLGDDADAAFEAARALAALDPDDALRREVERWRARWVDWPSGRSGLDRLARRGVGYVLACCAVPVGEAVCLVTDHRILPLAWTRDGYFMARALLAWAASGGPREAVDVVRRHLDWLFRVAERPEGWWARSHLVGGQRKDPVFQLDQQLYPLLELCDYAEVTRDRAPLERYAGEIASALRAVERRRARGTALYGSDENAADDPLELPYQTANQILAWRTFMRLHELDVGNGRLRELAESCARAVAERQVASSEDGRCVYAYATDLDGRAILYHDANDLPLVLAPTWGFCRAEDPVWRTTMRFALSPANPGFFPGLRGGLGSLHTPAAWPLGVVQAWLVARDAGDTRLRAESERTLRAQAFWDGSLPEASDPDDGRPVSRAWFAWPSAAVAGLGLRRGLAR